MAQPDIAGQAQAQAAGQMAITKMNLEYQKEADDKRAALNRQEQKNMVELSKAQMTQTSGLYTILKDMNNNTNDALSNILQQDKASWDVSKTKDANMAVVNKSDQFVSAELSKLAPNFASSQRSS
jgi:hypothetical protein